MTCMGRERDRTGGSDDAYDGDDYDYDLSYYYKAMANTTTMKATHRGRRQHRHPQLRCVPRARRTRADSGGVVRWAWMDAQMMRYHV